jgi:hypothetical protein
VPRLPKDTPEPPAGGGNVATPPPEEVRRQVAIFDNGAASYSEDLPQLGAPGRTRDPFPDVPAQSPFWLVYAPDRWGVVEGRLIPFLYRLSATPGANGVDRAGTKPEPSAALAGVERQGHVVLDWRIDGKAYLRSFQVGEGVDRKTGAPVKIMSWHTRWEQLYAGSKEIESDTGGYADWVVGLIEKGLLPKPRPYVLQRLRTMYANHLARALSKAGGREDDALVKQRRRDLTVIEAAIAALGQPAIPAAPVETDPSAELELSR